MARHVASVTDAILCHSNDGGHNTVTVELPRPPPPGHSHATAAQPRQTRRVTAGTDERCADGFIDDLRPRSDTRGGKELTWLLW